jgi:phosphoglycolate phosphatase
MIRLVLFDIDGTLIRTGGAGEKAFARVGATQFGVVNGTARLNFAGRTDPAIVREFFVLHGIEPSEANFRRFFESYVFLLDELLRADRAAFSRAFPSGFANSKPAPDRLCSGC